MALTVCVQKKSKTDSWTRARPLQHGRGTVCLHCSFIGVLFVSTRNTLRNQQKAIIVSNIAVVARSEKAEDTLGIMIAQLGAGR